MQHLWEFDFIVRTVLLWGPQMNLMYLLRTLGSTNEPQALWTNGNWVPCCTSKNVISLLLISCLSVFFKCLFLTFLKQFFFLDLVALCILGFCLYVCMYVICLPGALEGQKRISNPLWLELTVLSLCGSGRNRTWSLCNYLSNPAFIPWAHLTLLVFYCFLGARTVFHEEKL